MHLGFKMGFKEYTSLGPSHYPVHLVVMEYRIELCQCKGHPYDLLDKHEHQLFSVLLLEIHDEKPVLL